ncbi:MAG: DMT family transporter [Paracoccaceae bacterium]
MPPPAYRYLPAVLWVLASTALWTVIFAAAKFAGDSIGVFQITLLRYAGALATALVLAQARGGVTGFRSGTPGTHFLRALCGSGAAITITWASANMPLAQATALGMSYAVLLVLMGAVFLGEKPGRGHLWASAICVVGVGVVLLGKGAFDAPMPLVPALAALASAGLMAVEGLLIRVLGLRERPLTVMLYVCFFGFCLMLVPAWLTWAPIDPTAVVACVCLGPVALFAQYCTIRGYTAAPLSVVGPVDYSWIVFAAALGLVAFGEWPSLPTLIGCGLIVCGGVLLARTVQP